MKESQLENKTAIATNDYVRMVDENGNSVKIKKDSFMAAIRDALPSIISDGETGGGSVLSIINGALKTRTDANLASVLGGLATYSYTVTANTETKCFYGGGIFLLWLNDETQHPLVFISSTGKITKLNTTWFDGNLTIIRKNDDYLYITYTSYMHINIKKLI